MHLIVQKAFSGAVFVSERAIYSLSLLASSRPAIIVIIIIITFIAFIEKISTPQCANEVHRCIFIIYRYE